MIEEEIKKIRDAESRALQRNQEAERISKEVVEEGKRKIMEEIEERRKKLVEEIEKWKRSADADGKLQGEKILEEYREKVKKIEKIGEDRIKEVAQEIITEIFR